MIILPFIVFSFFFFNDTATTEIYTLSLHDALPISAVYRRAALVLQTSEAEGFGLPVIEAMACGTPVLASDIPALREVGGSSAMYCPVGEIAAWAESVVALLRERDREPESWCARRAAGINQAQKFNWAEDAKKMVGVFQWLLAE